VKYIHAYHTRAHSHSLARTYTHSLPLSVKAGGGTDLELRRLILRAELDEPDELDELGGGGLLLTITGGGGLLLTITGGGGLLLSITGGGGFGLLLSITFVVLPTAGVALSLVTDTLVFVPLPFLLLTISHPSSLVVSLPLPFLSIVVLELLGTGE
jgi:hypothetical protein